MNTITDLLDLEDSDLFISDVLVEGTRKLITLETHPVPHFLYVMWLPYAFQRDQNKNCSSSNPSGWLRADPSLETTSLALYQS